MMGKSLHVRRIIGLLGAALAVGVAALGSREFDTDRVQMLRQEARRTAEGAGQRAGEALSTQLGELKLKADNAAANPRLVFALQGNVDERTLRDLWRTEEWWRPWRTEFKVYGLAFSGVRLEVAEGTDAKDLEVTNLIRHARDRGETAAEIVTGRAGSYEAAATLVTVPGRERPVVLMLAKPIAQATLRGLVDKTGGAVALADGQKILLDAGTEAERALLTAAIAADPKATLYQAPNGAWAALRGPIGASLSLWTFASAGANAHDSEAVAGVALLLGFRRSHAATSGVAAGSQPAGEGIVGTLRGNGPLAPPEQSPGSGNIDRATGHSPTALSPVLMPRAAPGEMPFGRYTLLDRLGEGGMAEVYTAVTFGAEGFRRKFVIKRLRPELARETTMVDQFIDEANLASSMVHSNIVPVFDFGKVGDEYFIAQEYILGRDLARITRQSLERNGHPAPPATVLYVASETLKALEYAHTKTSDTGAPLGIVHRDVSPTNVLVSARGEVKLFDFGIVKAEGRVTRTQSGVVKGNVTFMSPEQARGGQIDARADLFSLGLVMFYVLTGRVLYAGDTTYELLVRAATGLGAQEQKQVRALPEPCGPLLLRALETNPASRYQSAREFRDAIAPHLGAGGVDLASLIQHLFAEDFRAEESRFRAVSPSASPLPGPDVGAPSPRRP
jgi:serine/threonine protein kinase